MKIQNANVKHTHARAREKKICTTHVIVVHKGQFCLTLPGKVNSVERLVPWRRPLRFYVIRSAYTVGCCLHQAKVSRGLGNRRLLGAGEMANVQQTWLIRLTTNTMVCTWPWWQVETLLRLSPVKAEVVASDLVNKGKERTNVFIVKGNALRENHYRVERAVSCQRDNSGYKLTIYAKSYRLKLCQEPL